MLVIHPERNQLVARECQGEESKELARCDRIYRYLDNPKNTTDVTR